jgi:hypothetical protein
MVSQYPHQLYLQNAGGAKNGNGDYVAGAQAFSLVSICRNQASSGGSTVTLEDATQVDYDSLLHAPLTCPVLSEGATVEVREGIMVRLRGTVKRFHKGQLHCRIWV